MSLYFWFTIAFSNMWFCLEVVIRNGPCDMQTNVWRSCWAPRIIRCMQRHNLCELTCTLDEHHRRVELHQKLKLRMAWPLLPRKSSSYFFSAYRPLAISYNATIIHASFQPQCREHLWPYESTHWPTNWSAQNHNLDWIAGDYLRERGAFCMTRSLENHLFGYTRPTKYKNKTAQKQIHLSVLQTTGI